MVRDECVAASHQGSVATEDGRRGRACSICICEGGLGRGTSCVDHEAPAGGWPLMTSSAPPRLCSSWESLTAAASGLRKLTAARGRFSCWRGGRDGMDTLRSARECGGSKRCLYTCLFASAKYGLRMRLQKREFSSGDGWAEEQQRKGASRAPAP
ncbi:hypothetical protein E2C01_081498 [Portunus trituberculatus]|uniref:Uncharacterized protein n=1 Tax=Portunus trituberculatus TaxID=210409 RepID=A0A5B7IS28_PORTR|nr:hypothetical protein [Portunus trituberculatus]